MGAREEAGGLLEAPVLAMVGDGIGCVGSRGGRRFLVQEMGKWLCTVEAEGRSTFSKGTSSSGCTCYTRGASAASEGGY